MTMERSAGYAIHLFVLLTLVTCGDGDATSSDEVERFTSGDTTIVRYHSGLGAWGDTMTLVPELEIGTIDGPPETVFGDVTSVAVRRDGNILVLDAQARAVREFDSRGRYVRTLGRAGEGPGEFGRPMAVRVDPAGRTLVLDWNQRMTVFSVDGTPERTWLLQGSRPAYDFTIDTLGNTYVLIRMPEPPGTPSPLPGENAAACVAYQRYAPDGTPGDTLPPGGVIMDPPGQLRVGEEGRWRPKGNFAPLGIVAIHPFGWTLTGVADRYAVDLTRYPSSGTDSTGSDRPRILRIERVVNPAPIVDEEWDEWQAYIDAWLEQRRERVSRVEAREGILLPDPQRPYFPEEPFKPYLRWPSFGLDGRIWINRYAPSVKEPPGALPEPEPSSSGPPPLPKLTWTEQFHYDVFEPDGTFLGTVVVPGGHRISTQEGMYVWGIRRDEFDVPYVFRAKLVAKGDLPAPER
ncbi:MAG: 6-bladed beta-propeller [Gemmatimonadota bacterium]|jgi:hypothetical protein